jgi:hypothetical protein
VNWQHFQAFVWLRWRMMVNQWRRAGAFSAVLMIVIAVVAVVVAVPLLIGSFSLGVNAIPKGTPMHLLYVWDGLIAVFLFTWMIGLITELQRSEPLSLSKFLHLPVSVKSAFLINYFSSLLRLSLIIFVPMMLGYSLALVFVKGAMLLPVLPALAAFLLMVTALTYQFQGWLSSLMNNPRRRRLVVVAVTVIFVLGAQLPSLLTSNFAPFLTSQAEQSRQLAKEMDELNRAFQADEFDANEYTRRLKELVDHDELATNQADSELPEQVEESALLANLVLPIGWLPLGVKGAAEGRLIPALLGILGMTLIGSASLWRAYRTTVAMYQGQATARGSQPSSRVAATPAGLGKTRTLLLERRIPGLSEPVTAIALGGLRSLLCSPEAKMMLMSPLIMAVIFGTMLLRRSGLQNVSDWIRPLFGVGAMFVVLFGVLQLMSNQFGFDRGGFRIFVLSAASRRDILLGKNLAFAPFVVGMALVLLVAVQVFVPMRVDHFLAMFPQFVSMFLLFCLLTNLLSIYAPIYIASGALRHSKPKMSVVLSQLLTFVILFPLTQVLTLLPLGIEVLIKSQGWIAQVPVYLILSLLQCAVVVLIYRLLLSWQGGLFQSREQQIVEIVTNRES